MALLTCSDVTFSYEGIPVLTDVNFALEAGSYLCIVGENGSGKSTLVKGLLHLKNPSTGSITTGDGLHPSEIGYLPQQTAAQKDFPASVWEVVLSGRQNHPHFPPFYTKADKEESAGGRFKLEGYITDHLKAQYTFNYDYVTQKAFPYAEKAARRSRDG